LLRDLDSVVINELVFMRVVESAGCMKGVEGSSEKATDMSFRIYRVVTRAAKRIKLGPVSLVPKGSNMIVRGGATP
jgi:hypothetical protein